MGKTPKPLTILAIGLAWEELNKLAEQGHTVDICTTRQAANTLNDFTKYDLIIGPTCHRMDDAHRKYLSLAIAEARRVRYPKGD